MTPTEFKAWFDGFTEALDGLPSKDQWKRIKERVGEIDGKSVTERVFVDRYVDRYPYYPRWYWQGASLPSGPQWISYNSAPSAGSSVTFTGNAMQSQAPQTMGFNSLSAMNSLGRAEAAKLVS